MGSQMALLQVRQAAPVLKQGLWEQTAVHPIAQDVKPAAEKLTRLNTDQNFSNVPVYHNGNSQTEIACPLSPRTCPFGGACHTCPVHVQPKLKISQPDDEYEREADRVADAVMRMPEPKEGAEEWCHLPGYTQIAQRQATNVATSSEVPPIVYEASRSSGQPLDDSTRTFMELCFRQDFGDVRVHTDALSAKSAQQINSLAYTTGQDITFAVGQFQPGMDHGRKLIAHELSHVIQQRASNCPRATVIQRWGPGAHKALTTDYTRKYLTFFERLEIDEDALKRFADSSADMDLRLPELWFNFKGKMVGVGKKMKLSKPEQALEQLKKAL